MMNSNKKPTFLCVGAMKAGTHTWFNMIKQHSKVFTGCKKELHFFNRNENYLKGKEYYLSQFPDTSLLIGEATPSYLNAEIAEKIYTMFPDTKIIIIIRNPVDRLISHYKMRNYIYDINTNIFQYVQEQSYLIECSKYYDAVKKYKELFGNNVQIIKFEDFIINPINTIKESCKFLDIEFENVISVNVDINESRKNSKFLAIIKRCVYNTFGYKTSQKLNDFINYKCKDLFTYIRLITPNKNYPVLPETKSKLLDLFTDDIDKLQKIIDFDISDYKG